MSKRSREKHARPQFAPTDAQPHDDADLEMCESCGFFPRLENRQICEECASMEQPT
jgi:uncharacterized paraquat-inducible protein A